MKKARIIAIIAASVVLLPLVLLAALYVARWFFLSQLPTVPPGPIFLIHLPPPI